MMIPVFSIPLGPRQYHPPGTTQALVDFDESNNLEAWRLGYAADLQNRLDEEGLGRELVNSTITPITGIDRYRLDLLIRYADGRTVAICETLEIAVYVFTGDGDELRIVTVGGVLVTAQS